MTLDEIATVVRLGVEVIAALCLPLGVGLVIYERLRGDRGLGARAIQFVTVVMIIPVILIMALEKVIADNIIGTLVGGLVGYLLSGVGNYEPSAKRSAAKVKSTGKSLVSKPRAPAP